MKRTYAHIDLDERRKIARWRLAGLSVEIIAEKGGRHRCKAYPSRMSQWRQHEKSLIILLL